MILIQAAFTDPPGVRTFYVASSTDRLKEWAVKYIRRRGERRWVCMCPHFFHVCQIKKCNCKHIKQVRAIVREYHGISKVPRGKMWHFEVPVA